MGLFGAKENRLIDAALKCPPDYEGINSALLDGADINVFEPEWEETILSDILVNYDYDKGAYLPELTEFLLHKGHDLQRMDGKYGSVAINALCYCTFDRYVLDVARILVREGAVADEETLENIAIHEDAAIVVYNDPEQEKLFYDLYELVAPQKESCHEKEENIFRHHQTNNSTAGDSAALCGLRRQDEV